MPERVVVSWNTRSTSGPACENDHEVQPTGTSALQSVHLPAVTRYADSVAWIVRQLHPELKSAGFRKRRHSFNRSVEDGVVEVINFQAGQKLAPGADPIPRLRPDLYGRLTVNLGVAVREAWEQYTRFEKEFPDFANAYDCQIRVRLGQVTGGAEDTWWPLSRDDSLVAIQIREGLIGPGLHWLERRATRTRILDIWATGGLGALPTATALPIVMVLRHTGRDDEAAAVLREYYDSVTPPPHRIYVFDVARSLGIDGLSPP